MNHNVPCNMRYFSSRFVARLGEFVHVIHELGQRCVQTIMLHYSFQVFLTIDYDLHFICKVEVCTRPSNKSAGFATQDIVETGKKRDLAITKT